VLCCIVLSAAICAVAAIVKEKYNKNHTCLGLVWLWVKSTWLGKYTGKNESQKRIFRPDVVYTSVCT